MSFGTSSGRIHFCHFSCLMGRSNSLIVDVPLICVIYICYPAWSCSLCLVWSKYIVNNSQPYINMSVILCNYVMLISKCNLQRNVTSDDLHMYHDKCIPDVPFKILLWNRKTIVYKHYYWGYFQKWEQQWVKCILLNRVFQMRHLVFLNVSKYLM